MKKRDKLYVVLGLVAGFVFLLIYFGIVGEIKITEQEVGPFKVAYKTHIGDYSEIGKIQDEIYYSLVADGINASRGFGVYYDNPQEVDKERLRSEGGVIIEKNDYSRISELKGKYNIKDIPKFESVVATFPYRNKFSILIGIMRVYPKLNNYLVEQGYSSSPAMEIYDIENHQIVYLFEIR